jgi:hypothetical protein
MAPSTSSSSGRSPTTSRRSSSTLRTTSGSMSRTRTPERYGGAAPRGLLPGLVPMVDGQEGGGSGRALAQRSEVSQGRGRAPSRCGSRPRYSSSPARSRTSSVRWAGWSVIQERNETGVFWTS